MSRTQERTWSVEEGWRDINVEKQYSDSTGDVAYLMADISRLSKKDIHELQTKVSQTRSIILTRLLS
jgi:D-3-phosphoglycerate dehydrogenase